jgi:hypothetical protein
MPHAIVARHSQPGCLVYVVQPVKVLLIAAISLAACDLSDKEAVDGRPLELGYVTEAILKPTCGTAECHSSFHAEAGDVYDTVAGAQATLADKRFGLVLTCERLTIPQTSPCGGAAAAASYLITVISDRTAEGDRMPLDQVMSRSDQELLGQWIEQGAIGLDLGNIHQ